MKHAHIQILILRLVVGFLFLQLGLDKYHEGWFSSPMPLEQSLTGYEQIATGYNKAYLETVALPHISIWSKAIPAGEFLLGVSLIMGCFVRLATVTGMLMLLNLYAANGSIFSLHFFGTPWSALLLASLLILLLARAGRWAGLDALFAKSNSRSIFW